ncbi:hypothetical protein CVO77_18720 [Sphingopyxis lindanitolerans]|uniref:Uncharacterized protein n=1 Tax=Sphingopyxis lindanitolerans TaxID=2054227 RepID=A0A2S8B3S4_9SPHN|nr:hypothetical protein [Sphingopyxis lindanitolerans]PQM27000.1 hypothetical protein CVO77_18720 [Sphingopyxis lindanitolerans]
MLLVAICADSAAAEALRPVLLAAHGQYLLSLESLRFSAPLARRDDALFSGEGIESSVIILEGSAWPQLVETLLADPYAVGGVWAKIGLYEMPHPPVLSPGEFLVDLTRDGRWYLKLFSGSSVDTGALKLVYRDGWAGTTTSASSTKVVGPLEVGGWSGMSIAAAADMSTALNSVSAADVACVTGGVSSTLAVPVAAGSWTKRP